MDIAGISNRVRTARQQKGWSLQKLAQEANLSKSYIWQIEIGRQKNITLDAVNSLSVALQLSVQDVLGLSKH